MATRRRRRSSSDHDARLVDAIVVPRYGAHFARPMLDAIPEGARMILDVCCATGFLSFHALERLGPTGRVIAIDPDAGLIELARRRGWEEIGKRLFFKVDSPETLSFGDEVFDVVFANLALPRLEDAPEALAEMRRVLAPDGLLAISTRLAGTFRTIHDMLAEIAVAEDDPSLRERLEQARDPDVPRFEALVRDAGFREVEVRCDTFRLPYRNAAELFADRLLQLEALPEWEEIAGRAERLEDVARRLDVYFAGGPFSLEVHAGVAFARP